MNSKALLALISLLPNRAHGVSEHLRRQNQGKEPNIIQSHRQLPVVENPYTLVGKGQCLDEKNRCYSRASIYYNIHSFDISSCGAICDKFRWCIGISFFQEDVESLCELQFCCNKVPWEQKSFDGDDFLKKIEKSDKVSYTLKNDNNQCQVDDAMQQKMFCFKKKPEPPCWPEGQTFENHIGLSQMKRDDSWSVWNRESGVEYDNVKCEPTIFRPSTATDIEGSICIHPPDVDTQISARIVRIGRWRNCDNIVVQWNEAQQLQHEKRQNHGFHDHKIDLYIDIGANIGTCLLEMIFSTNAFIMAFEPDPRNFAMITKTLAMYDKSVRDRVALFPIALSSSFSRTVINTANHNRGNAVVGDKIIKDVPDQVFLPPIPITAETLDSIFEGVNFNNIGVMLIKMDVQGFECNVIDGGERVFAAADVVVTESVEKFLTPQGCSVQGLLERIQNLDFEVDSPRGTDITARKQKN